jgi:hypothetical protein
MFMRFSRIVVFLMLALAAAGAAPVPPQPRPTGTYSDSVYSFTMATPSFAEVKQDRAIIAIFQAPLEDGFTSNVTVMADPVTTTRKDYLQDSMSTLATTNPRATIRSLKELQVTGKDAELLDYDATMAGRRLRFLQLLVVSTDRVYVVTCTAPVDSFQKYETQFQKCIDSFRLDK